MQRHRLRILGRSNHQVACSPPESSQTLGQGDPNLEMIGCGVGEGSAGAFLATSKKTGKGVSSVQLEYHYPTILAPPI